MALITQSHPCAKEALISQSLPCGAGEGKIHRTILLAATYGVTGTYDRAAQSITTF